MIFPFPLYYIPYVSEVSSWTQSFYEMAVPWFGRTFFGIEGDIAMQGYGSGDYTGSWLQIALVCVLAVIGTLIWSLIERKKKDYTKINYWFITCLRYYVAAMMLSYGLIKIIQLQFPEPHFYRLLQPYGDSSPMGLAWTYMGLSPGFNMFVGMGEFIGGLLLLHRRTTVFGSIVLISVTMNIMAVNYFFDVPVKIFSTQLFFMAVIILTPHFKRLANVIFNLGSTETHDYYKPFKKKVWRIAHLSVKTLFIGYLLYTYISGDLKGNKEYGAEAPKPELYGLYETEDFIKNSDTIPPLLTDTERWRYLIIENTHSVSVLDMNKGRTWYKQDSIDVLKNTLRFSSYRDTTEIYTFKYTKTDTTMTMNGLVKGDTLKINFKRKTKQDFLLMNRGFHWINERPYNR